MSSAAYEWNFAAQMISIQKGDTENIYSKKYLQERPLLKSISAEKIEDFPILLIDEIDKADIEFPNDLLLELDKMEFFVYETGETIKAQNRPIVIITSNNEKELPDAFLRRCFFHYIKFPDPNTMEEIVEVHYPDIKKDLIQEAFKIFYDIREVPGIKKKPSTSELIDWLKLLMTDDVDAKILREKDPKKLIPPLHGALLKNEQDVHLFERLAFISRRENENVE